MYALELKIYLLKQEENQSNIQDIVELIQS